MRPNIMLLSIQYLRAIAAISVVLFHMWQVYFPDAENPLFPGSAGVDVFFVISGFIMWHITSGKEVRPGEFLLHRSIRIIPLYWLITLSLAAAALLKPNLFPLDKPTLPHVLLSLLFIPHLSPDGVNTYPFLTQGWTLVYEFLFYAFFAFALLFKARHRFFIISAIIVLLVSYGILFKPKSIYGAWITSSYLIEFYAGIIVSILVRHKLILANIASIFTAVFCIIAIIMTKNESVVEYRALYWGIPSAVLVWAFISCEKSGAMNNFPFLILLGNASYSIYLVHFLVASFLNIALGLFNIEGSGFLFFVIGSLFAITCGIVTYLVVELPLLRAMRGFLRFWTAVRETNHIRFQ
ncbi:acyltransferase family protein [Agrobacterium larrymoorei]|uniref:Acyltransferase n=1 Tax=Agrobacterium larrymoorei TaxID=160699 RepID=A0AAF0HEX3_9HYPH|nr:acyltransferase [Agrobacterium larrymoorei]WHA43221.1 acyltransferase [Agrobacterium larrymoorei]